MKRSLAKTRAVGDGTAIALAFRMKTTLLLAAASLLLTLGTDTARADDVESAEGFVCRVILVPPGTSNDLGNFGHVGFRLTSKQNCSGFVLQPDLRVCSTGATDGAFCDLDATFTEIGLQTVALVLRDAAVQQFAIRIEKHPFGRGVANIEILGTDR